MSSSQHPYGISRRLPQSGAAKPSTLRDDPANRILSVSFKRDRAEHLAVSQGAARRMAGGRRLLSPGPVLAGCVLSGAALGLLMEAYQRFVLVPLFDTGGTVPLPLLLLQALPLLILGFGLVYGLGRWSARLRRQAMFDRLAPEQFVDIDVFADGISIVTGSTTVSAEWRHFRDLVVLPDRLELDGELTVFYLPRRAFATRQEFDDAVKRIQSLWEAAQKPEPLRADAPVKSKPSMRSA